MKIPVVLVQYGALMVSWTKEGDLRIVRQDNGQNLDMSITEWEVLLRIMDLRGWPVVPPEIVRSGTVQSDDTRIQAGG